MDFQLETDITIADDEVIIGESTVSNGFSVGGTTEVASLNLTGDITGGIEGPQGPQGLDGPVGPKGDTGEPGADGAPGVVQAIIAGTNVTVDNTDPANPIISSTENNSGTGDVVGPATSVAGALTVFADTTGKIVRETSVYLQDYDAPDDESLVVPNVSTRSINTNSVHVTTLGTGIYLDGKLTQGVGAVELGNITESTLDAGVTIDGVLVKDGLVDGRDISIDGTKLDGIESGAQVNTVTSVAAKTGAVTLIKNDVGLGNVDNTSDATKNSATATLSNKTFSDSVQIAGSMSAPTTPAAGYGKLFMLASGASEVIPQFISASGSAKTLGIMSKTTDANGWTVYDNGLWKEYAIVATGLSTSSLGSLANASIGSINAPAGVAPADLHTSVEPYAGYDISRYFITIVATSGTAGASVSINARNITGATLSDSGMQVKVRAIAK